MMMTVTIDGVTTVPEFGGWACYDRHAHRWLTTGRIKSLVSAWFERYGAPFSGRTLDDPAVMGAFVHAWDWVDWEFLETPREVSMGQRLKNDLDRIDQILDASWERHQQRVLRLRRLSRSA
jgi:hypothetical protein